VGIWAGGGATSARTGASPSAKTITEAVEEWVHEEGREWKKKTLDETQRALRWLVQVVGDVRPDTVKREDMKRFKANVERVPRGTAATADIRTFAAKVPERPLDRARVTKVLVRVVAFFSWTVDRQWIRTSPAAGLRKNGKKRGREARELRESFTRQELASIFGADYGTNESTSPARFWVPLLALYTGARRGELAQLLVRDVREEEGVLVLNLNDDGHGKSLKTEASRRRVPVHSQVIELGSRSSWKRGDMLERSACSPTWSRARTAGAMRSGSGSRAGGARTASRATRRPCTRCGIR